MVVHELLANIMSWAGALDNYKGAHDSGPQEVTSNGQSEWQYDMRAHSYTHSLKPLLVHFMPKLHVTEKGFGIFIYWTLQVLHSNFTI